MKLLWTRELPVTNFGNIAVRMSLGDLAGDFAENVRLPFENLFFREAGEDDDAARAQIANQMSNARIFLLETPGAFFEHNAESVDLAAVVTVSDVGVEFYTDMLSENAQKRLLAIFSAIFVQMAKSMRVGHTAQVTSKEARFMQLAPAH